ncbi:protein phosphatase 2C domain-containing protein [Mycobacteroides sp. LB1]|uniref:protein phosphatase 2C domain-containing protein n=1 Tax=Mycobacteroides sp. LB1 TaxID=2750814 RepID=UPI0015DF79A2|nr:protein phosphatase 2C domain-containing protein [Mycobacteroides sp. LB1]
MPSFRGRWTKKKQRPESWAPEYLVADTDPIPTRDPAASPGAVPATTEVPGELSPPELRNPVLIPQLVIGAPSPTVEPSVIAEPFGTIPFRPDTALDGWSTDHFTVRGASVRGHLHRYNGAPRQDEFAVHHLPSGRLLVLVADGVSQARLAHIGAMTVVRAAAQWIQKQLPVNTEETDWRGMVDSVAWAMAEQAKILFGLDAPDSARAEQELATTLVCAVIDPLEYGTFRAHIVGVGDSGAWLLRHGTFTPLLKGKTVDKDGFSSSAVSGLPRVPPHEIRPTVVHAGANDVLLVGTDGIGDPLGKGEGGVGNLIRELLGRADPPSLIEFAHAIDFSREAFDDDRTLVTVAARRSSSQASPLIGTGLSAPSHGSAFTE